MSPVKEELELIDSTWRCKYADFSERWRVQALLELIESEPVREQEYINMSDNGKNGHCPDKCEFVKIAEDDKVWIYTTSKPQVLVDLVENPGEWMKRTHVGPAPGLPKRPAILLDNFVITMDVATSIEPKSSDTYAIDGIDNTGFITVRMASPGGRFPFKSPTKYDEAEEKIMKLNPELVVAQSGDRCFIHLELGKDPDLRKAVLCAAIENQQWLWDLYGKLPVIVIDDKGCRQTSDRKLKFGTVTEVGGGGKGGGSTLGQPKLEVIYQGQQSTLDSTDACNVSTGNLVEEFVLVDGVMVKIYAPA